MSKSSKDLPYGRKRSEDEKSRVDHVLGRKSGGRVKDDEGTNIHIEINADPKREQVATDLPPPMAGPAPPPPPMPPMPPPGPGGAPMGGGGPLGLKRGGAAKAYAEGGGVKQGDPEDMYCGSGSGGGRLEKIGKKP